MSAVSIQENSEAVNLIIEVDGQALPRYVPVYSVEVIRQANRIPFAKIKISDGLAAEGDFEYSSSDDFLPGNKVSVIAGYADDSQVVFSGDILRQKVVVKPDTSWLEVECRDPAVKMTIVKSTRYHEEVTDSDVIQNLIGEYDDIEASILATEVTHPQLLQYHASDWDFMISRLEANGQICFVTDATITSVKPDISAEPLAEVSFGNNLIELDAEFDARSQSAGVKTTAWNPTDQVLEEIEAAAPSWETNSNLTVDDMLGATARETDVLIHGGSLSSDALQAWADGALLRSRVASSRGRARFSGIAEIQLGTVLQLSSISDRFNGKVYITGIRHQFADNNWLTDIEFGLPTTPHTEIFAVNHLPAAGLAAAVHGLQVGIVTEIADDPAGENRVRVKIPVAGMDEQGVWARVATLDAGAERGTFFRPEVDDEVVLGFFHNDPAHPVILGMLHSSAKPPPVEATADNHEKAYVSREGLRFHFDDEKKIITLETPGGNKIMLTDEDSGILLEDQNGNSLTMDSNGISIVSAGEIKLEASGDLKAEATNSEIKASAEFKAEGGASAEVSSSGTMTVKGSLVQIN